MKLNNRNDLRTLRAELESAVKDIESRHGININVGSMSYDLDGSTASIKITTTDNAVAEKTGGMATPEALDFTRRAAEFGLDPDWLGETFTKDGERWKVIGLKPRSRKYPVLVKRADGKVFKISAGIVQALCGGAV